MLFIFASRLKRRTHNPSPLLISYRADYLIGMLTDGGVIITFALAAGLVDLGKPGIGDRIDPAVALAIALYMVSVGVSLVRHNFRALMDLPLSEEEQFTITRGLAHHYADYDAVGALSTRSSGKRRFVEVERPALPHRARVGARGVRAGQALSVLRRLVPASAVRGPTSTFSAASSCIPGFTCDRVSSVILVEA